MSNPLPGSLVDVFSAESRIKVAYLFGSQAGGLQTPHSDTDIAILLSHLPKDLLELHLHLVDELSEALGGPVDLVILNTAPPLLRHQVIRHGRVIYCQDERAQVEFEARAEKEYMDLKRGRDRYDEALLEEISSWKD